MDAVWSTVGGAIGLALGYALGAASIMDRLRRGRAPVGEWRDKEYDVGSGDVLTPPGGVAMLIRLFIPPVPVPGLPGPSGDAKALPFEMRAAQVHGDAEVVAVSVGDQVYSAATKNAAPWSGHAQMRFVRQRVPLGSVVAVWVKNTSSKPQVMRARLIGKERAA